jgi:hypothetical protein
MAANELYEKASSNGYSQSQLTRAGKRIGVRKDKAGMDSGWLWSLPAKKTPSVNQGQPDNQDEVDFSHMSLPTSSSHPSTKQNQKGDKEMVIPHWLLPSSSSSSSQNVKGWEDDEERRLAD